MRLLEKEGLAGLNTNRIAATAGVSVGTLYQYFPNKEAILDALADREMAALSARVLAAMAAGSGLSAEERVIAVVRAAAESYGGRRAAHRAVMTHSLGRGGNRLAPMFGRLIALLSGRVPATGGPAAPMSETDAFVLTHAFAGVMRAMAGGAGSAGLDREEIERAMARLVLRFVSPA